MTDLVTSYNDTCKGRCAICLEEYNEGGHDENEEFSSREDLMRIDECFHRFHVICVWRYCFMPRVSEMMDGVEMKY